jgi:hypothetical protein
MIFLEILGVIVCLYFIVGFFVVRHLTKTKKIESPNLLSFILFWPLGVLTYLIFKDFGKKNIK